MNSQERKSSDEARRFSPQNKKHDVGGSQKSRKRPNACRSYTGKKKSKHENNDILQLHRLGPTFHPDTPDPLNLTPTNTLNPQSNFLLNLWVVHPIIPANNTHTVHRSPMAHTSTHRAAWIPEPNPPPISCSPDHNNYARNPDRSLP